MSDSHYVNRGKFKLQPSFAGAGLWYCDRLPGKLEIFLPAAAFQQGDHYFRLAGECIPNLVSWLAKFCLILAV
ncbi:MULTISPECIES: hypothetical protein [unclassified Nostoc]|uniref:hypothetical protein n=1 Tax=unclassified Nostoc TaxID=2593658 RepID=UPI0026339ECD|nr:hypothetical protein [Nostoc sp. S13]MDF5739385.1 hypothetical protein [Nostoc sp. S13]